MSEEWEIRFLPDGSKVCYPYGFCRSTDEYRRDMDAHQERGRQFLQPCPAARSKKSTYTVAISRDRNPVIASTDNRPAEKIPSNAMSRPASKLVTVAVPVFPTKTRDERNATRHALIAERIANNSARR